MGSRVTSILAVILSSVVLIGAGILFFFGFTDFKPESTQGLTNIGGAQVDTSKLPVIDVGKFLEKNQENNASITFINGSNINSGSLYTYPTCAYIEDSLEVLLNKSKSSSFKITVYTGQSIKLHIKPSQSSNSIIDFCGEHGKLLQSQAIAVGTGIVAAVILSLVVILTILIVCGVCSNSNLPLVVSVIGVIGFCSGVVCFSFIIYVTVNYYCKFLIPKLFHENHFLLSLALRGLESADVATDYGFPKQGNNLFYLFGSVCILFSNLIFIVMMFTASRQRKREIILNAARQYTTTATI
uniref:Transmembrane domain-containing protein n=1 Tax=Strongyloides venezuelensis TaxID=75913 RepID=A0A0K0G3Y1_STRVS